MVAAVAAEGAKTHRRIKGTGVRGSVGSPQLTLLFLFLQVLLLPGPSLQIVSNELCLTQNLAAQAGLRVGLAIFFHSAGISCFRQTPLTPTPAPSPWGLSGKVAPELISTALPLSTPASPGSGRPFWNRRAVTALGPVLQRGGGH